MPPNHIQLRNQRGSAAEILSDSLGVSNKNVPESAARDYMPSDMIRLAAADDIDARKALPLRSNSKGSYGSRSQSPLVSKMHTVTSPSVDQSAVANTNSEKSQSPQRRIVSDLR